MYAKSVTEGKKSSNFRETKENKSIGSNFEEKKKGKGIIRTYKWRAKKECRPIKKNLIINPIGDWEKQEKKQKEQNSTTKNSNNFDFYEYKKKEFLF